MISNLPGYEIVEKGLEDIRHGQLTEYSYLLYSAQTRFNDIGIKIEGEMPADSSVKAFQILESKLGNGAHSAFNALNRQLLSFIKATEQQIKNRTRTKKAPGNWSWDI